MSEIRGILGILISVVMLGCGAMPDRGGPSSGGTIQSIEHIDRFTAGVAGVLASGAIGGGPVSAADPNGAGGGGAKSGAAVAGAVASAAAPAGEAPRSEVPGYRLTIKLDSGSMRSVDQADVSALRVGQRVRIDKDRVLPE
jgi:outer membrane lipoprotein SlyB